jgi:predicted nucleic-acid-binding protein
VAEAVWVLATGYAFKARNIADALEILLDHRQLTFQEAEAVADALVLYRGSPALGFSDCLMMALARKAGHLPLGTFDRRLAKVDGAQLLGARRG